MTSATPAAPSLRLREGPLAGREVPVEGELSIGREDADLTITDAELSRRHAIIRERGGELEIEDAGSLNGTWVNDNRIDSPTRLADGDEVKLGATLLEVVIPQPGAAATLVSALPPEPRRAPVVAAQDVSRRYGDGETAVHALRGVSLEIAGGELTAVMGPSGSGKSTLMHILAGLDRPTSGSAWIEGVDITKLDDADLTRLRRERIGFVFQFFNLLPTLTLEENVLLPQSIARNSVDRDFTNELLERVGLAERRKHRPSQLSGGQQQRVAIARALASRPAVVFADEPTGNLDSETGGEILTLLRESVESYGQTTVMVTHDPRAAAIADRVLFLADGRIEKDVSPTGPEDVLRTSDEIRLN